VNRAELESVLRAQLIEKGIKPGFSLKSPDYMCFLGYAYTLLDEVCARYPDAEQVDFVVSRNGKITDHIKTFHEELRAHVKEFDPRLAALRENSENRPIGGDLSVLPFLGWSASGFQPGATDLRQLPAESSAVSESLEYWNSRIVQRQMAAVTPYLTVSSGRFGLP
jgi:hypothetical protein